MKVVRMSQAVDTVAELVRLRRWALSVLQFANGSDAVLAPQPYPAVSDASLSLFLTVERCAAPLAGAIGRIRRLTTIPAEATATINAAALNDANHVLRAERDARQIGAELHARNESAILLKGGVAAVLQAEPPLTLHDLDLLVTERTKAQLEQILKTHGFIPAETNELHHTCWFPPDGRLPVEVHWTTHSEGKPESPAVWARATPLGDSAGLSRLDWADQVVHLVRHSIEQHRDRHVTIRDLLLAGWFIGHVPALERKRLEANVEALTDPLRSAAFLDFAQALHTGRLASDPFEDEAILHFSARALLEGGPLWSGGPRPAWHNAATVAAGRMSLPRLVLFASRNPVTGVDSFAAIQRRAPAAGALLTQAARGAFYFGSTVIGVPLLLTLQRKVRERLRTSSS